jgi:endoglucanase
MTNRDHHRVRAAGVAGAAVLLLLAAGASASGCIGVSQKRKIAGVVGGDPADLKICRTGVRPADEGMIDDLEDGNNQVALEGGRDGYWWPKKDEKGSTLDPEPFAPSEGGAAGSEMAMHAHGKTSSADGAWGAGFGVNMLNQGKLYDASRYAGFSFKAKAGAASTKHVRFKIADINTHKDGGICTTACWNHFGKELSLTPEWKEYRVLFSEARQEDYWGDPRPPAVTPSKLIAVDWSIGTGQNYDIWVDDLTFIDCK